MVFICLHPAAKIPHITKTIQQYTGTYYGVELYAYSDNNTNKPKPKITNTGTYYNGVYLDAYSSKNTTYNQSLTISQEQTMVLLWLHPAITIPINQANNITGTYASGVYLSAYSKLQQTKKTQKSFKKKKKIIKNEIQ